MKEATDPEKILEQMAAIKRMERGKICRLAGRPHYNHQTWLDGRNVSRYVPAEEVASLQEAIDGYNLFRTLAETYADAVIERTRAECDRLRGRRQAAPKARRPPQAPSRTRPSSESPP